MEKEPPVLQAAPLNEALKVYEADRPTARNSFH